MSKHRLINNYSPKWRWIVVDIYRAAKRRGKYPPLSPTLRWIIVLVYTTQAEYLAAQRATLFVTIIRQKPFCFPGCSEVNSTWLITSELVNKRARKVLFTCVVYTKYIRTAMIILHFDLQPQFKYMNYFIYTSHYFTPHRRMNSINWPRSQCVAS